MQPNHADGMAALNGTAALIRIAIAPRFIG
jgi:hypothetical protein